MRDRLERGQAGFGDKIELRNVEVRDGNYTTRRTWTKTLTVAVPGVSRWIGGTFYRDTAGDPHWLLAGDDGVLYHCGTEALTALTAVVIYADEPVTWGETYRAKFCAWQDDCFVCVSQPPEIADAVAVTAQNLRFDGLSTPPAAFGVSLAEPATDPAAADNGAGNILYGDLYYKVTFKDVDTGWESAASAVVPITLTRPDSPQYNTLVATPGGGGTLGAGYYMYGVSFYNFTDGRESLMGQVIGVTVAANERVTLTGIPICPETVGTWYRRIWRANAGGAFYLVTTLANNTAQTYLDDTADVITGGTLYAADTTGRVVRLTNVPVYAGTGRTIHRCIWRSDDGVTYAMLVPVGNTDSIDNNITNTYDDNDAVPTGGTYAQAWPVPPMAFVAGFSDDQIAWAFDLGNVVPSGVYPADGPDTPEALALVISESGSAALDRAYAGSRSEPITAFVPVRDSIFIGKARSIYIMGRRCKAADCRRLIEGVGVVNDATVQVIDSRVAFLSPEGPRLLTHYSQGDVIFCGSDPYNFDLATTWDTVVRARLPYAFSVHIPDQTCVIWWVQACASWPITPPHSDLAIVWDYGAANDANPGGKVRLADYVGLDCAWQYYPVGNGSPVPYVGAAFGWAGKLLGERTGNTVFGDGTTQALTGEIVSIDGTTVVVNAADLAGFNVVGSRLFPRRGTGSHFDEAEITVCDGPNEIITGEPCSGTLTTAGPLALAAGTKFWIGGFQFVDHGVVNNSRDPDSITIWQSLQLQRAP